MSDAPDAARALDQASGAAVHRRREGERASEGLNKRHSEDGRVRSRMWAAGRSRWGRSRRGRWWHLAPGGGGGAARLAASEEPG